MSTLDAKLAQPYKLLHEGKLDQALALASRIFQQNPGQPPAIEAMRLICLCRQEFDRAIYYARKLAESAPTDPHARADLATTLMHAKRFDESVELMRAVVRDHPDQDWAHALLVAVLHECGRYREAEQAARDGLVLHPHHTPLQFRLASALMEQGRAREGNDVLQALLRDHRDDLTVAMQLATTSLYEFPCEPARVAAAHLNFGRLLEIGSFTAPLRHDRPAAGAARSSPLRVGFLSSDFRRHSVAAFIEALFEHLDRKLIRPHAYFTRHHGDDVTARLKAHVERGGAGAFATVGVLSDEDLARRIALDKVDVLIDLNGVTTSHRLGVLRLRPAPVQMTYCGYPATTGLRTIDYRLVDSITDPPGHEKYLAERPLRLDPCFLCYRPPSEAPAPAPHSAHADGRVVFGSFNMILKVNAGVIELWSRLLRRVPTAHLMVKSLAFTDATTREDFAARFIAAGAPADRIQMLPPIKEQGGHLAAYHRVDVALDTFPYTGTTTTCEALYMGVPVVTLCPPAEQSMHAARVSASLFTAVGATDLIASTPDEYLDIAAGLAADPARRAALRSSLRDRLIASPLMDAPAFCRRFERAVVGAWEAWAAGR